MVFHLLLGGLLSGQGRGDALREQQLHIAVESAVAGSRLTTERVKQGGIETERGMSPCSEHNRQCYSLTLQR